MAMGSRFPNPSHWHLLKLLVGPNCTTIAVKGICPLVADSMHEPQNLTPSMAMLTHFDHVASHIAGQKHRWRPKIRKAISETLTPIGAAIINNKTAIIPAPSASNGRSGRCPSHDCMLS